MGSIIVILIFFILVSLLIYLTKRRVEILKIKRYLEHIDEFLEVIKTNKDKLPEDIKKSFCELEDFLSSQT